MRGHRAKGKVRRAGSHADQRTPTASHFPQRRVVGLRHPVAHLTRVRRKFELGEEAAPAKPASRIAERYSPNGVFPRPGGRSP